MAGYIGGRVAVSVPQQVEAKFTITATASQTSITNVSYTVGSVHVFQNGVRLVDGTDFTATNGSTVTLETGATEGDQIVIVSHGSFETGDVVSKASGGTFSSAIAVDGSITATSLVIPDGSLPLVDLDIDGGTDIGAALVDADLMIVDDGAGGTNRKATMSRLATYMGTKIGGGLEFIATADASNTATISFTGFDASKYDSYLFTFLNVVSVNDGTGLDLQTSTDSGSNYDSGASDYLFQYRGDKGGSGFADYDATRGHMKVSADQGTASGEEGGLSGHIFMHGPHIALPTRIVGQSTYRANDGNGVVIQTAGQRHSSADVDAVKFLMGGGNIASGTITMYGLVNS